MKKFFNTLGFWFNKVTIANNLTFADLGNPLFTLNGTFLVNLKTAIADSFRFRDNTKGFDIISIDTDLNIVELGENYDGQGFAGKQRIFVNQTNVASTLGGTIDSTKEYFIDGIVDCTGVSIEIPATGIYLKGYNFDTSQLVCSDSSYTMFTSPVGGSGNVLMAELSIEVSGTSSKVFDIFSDTGFEAVEINIVNFNNCTSLGTITNYRQGLETGTGRFGGKPELTLAGVWVGGYTIRTSIVRSLTAGTYNLFKAGTGFLMSSRFKTDINCDLPASASFVDFAPANFVNPSTLQFDGVLLTRAGVYNSTDSLLTPNISYSDLASNWTNCQGLQNTFVGGFIAIGTELETTINTVDVPETVVATAWTTSDLVHFDNPSGGQLRHLGNNPREYRLVYDLHVKGTASKVVTIRVKKYDSSLTTFSTVFDQQRVVNNLVGSDDKAFFNIDLTTTLDQNDYIYLEIINNTDDSNLTVENSSFFRLEQR